MKRATGFEFAPGFLELYAATEHLDDICSRDQIVDKMLWYQAAHIILNGYSGFEGLAPTLLFLLFKLSGVQYPQA